MYKQSSDHAGDLSGCERQLRQMQSMAMGMMRSECNRQRGVVASLDMRRPVTAVKSRAREAAN
jgi:hypothetical protein